MATFEKRTNENKTVFRAKIRVKGYKSISATFDRLTDARIWANKVESDMKTGKYIDVSEGIKHTLSDLIDRYIAEKLSSRNPKGQLYFKNKLIWWKSEIGDLLLNSITPNVIAKERDKLKTLPNQNATKTKRLKTGSTVNGYLATLSIVFTKAVKEWGWMLENPILKVDKCKENKPRTRFLSTDEQNRLLEACKQANTPLLFLLVVIALSTGARKGEIINLEWNNLKFDDRSKTVTLYFMETKNGENRSVTIGGLAYKLLKERQQEALKSKVRQINSKNYVFISPTGQKPYYLRRQWYNALKQADIKDFRFHDLRHTTASNLAMNGASLRDIGEILGHKTPAMTQRYSHLTQKYTTKILKQLNDIQFNGVSV